MFYNTGIATYIWVLGQPQGRACPRRTGKVQLIDATKWFKPLTQEPGQEELRAIRRGHPAGICDTFLAFEETEQSKIFPNDAFGYGSVTVERPLRLRGIEADRAYSSKEIKALRASGAEPDEQGDPVIRKIHKSQSVRANPLHGRFERQIDGELRVVEYEPDSDLRDSEQVPLLDVGGVDGFIRREVLPYAADAWVVPGSIKIGYEINFNRHFFKPVGLRSLEEIRADILRLERETDGLLEGIVGLDGAQV